MEEKVRSGKDRREDTEDSPEKFKRSGRDRRETVQNYYRFIKVLEKIPIFGNLNIEQSQKILSICSKRQFIPGEYLCIAGDESIEMFLLLAGELEITLPDGKAISKIKPLGIVGEMGIFTDESRSASIVATKKTIVLIISKLELLNLFQKDCILAVHILLNVIKDLAQKLKTNNILMDEMRQVVLTGEFSKILSKAILQDDEV